MHSKHNNFTGTKKLLFYHEWQWNGEKWRENKFHFSFLKEKMIQKENSPESASTAYLAPRSHLPYAPAQRLK